MNDYPYTDDYRNHVPDHEFDGSWEIPTFTEWLIRTRRALGKPLYPFLTDGPTEVVKPPKAKEPWETELDRNGRYSFQLSGSGRTLLMTIDELKTHPEYSKETVISVDSGIGPDSERIWSKYEKQPEKPPTPRMPDEAQFQKGHTYRCRKCGHVVKTYEEWASISEAAHRVKHLLYDEHDEEIHICPKCGEYALNWDSVLAKTEKPETKQEGQQRLGV